MSQHTLMKDQFIRLKVTNSKTSLDSRIQLSGKLKQYIILKFRFLEILLQEWSLLMKNLIIPCILLLLESNLLWIKILFSQPTTSNKVGKLTPEFYKALLKHGTAMREELKQKLWSSPKIEQVNNNEYWTERVVDKSQSNVSVKPYFKLSWVSYKYFEKLMLKMFIYSWLERDLKCFK